MTQLPEVDKPRRKDRANRHTHEQPAHAHPQIVLGILKVLNGAAEVEGAEVLEAFAHFHLLRKLLSLAAQFLAVVFEGLFHGCPFQLFNSLTLQQVEKLNELKTRLSSSVMRTRIVSPYSQGDGEKQNSAGGRSRLSPERLTFINHNLFRRDGSQS